MIYDLISVRVGDDGRVMPCADGDPRRCGKVRAAALADERTVIELTITHLTPPIVNEPLVLRELAPKHPRQSVRVQVEEW